MGFSIEKWALSWALGKGANALIEKFKPSPLDQLLKEAVTGWADKLPEDRRLTPETFFALSEGEPSGPHKDLIDTLKQGNLPEHELWLVALMAKWEQIRNATSDGSGRGFFLLEPEQARDHLDDLARRLRTASVKEAEVFRPAVLKAIEEIQARLESLDAGGQASREVLGPSRAHLAALCHQVKRKVRSLRREQRDFEILLTQVDSFQAVLEVANKGVGGRDLTVAVILKSTPVTPRLLSAPAGTGKTSLLCRMVLEAAKSDMIPFYIDLGLQKITRPDENQELAVEELFQASLAGSASSFTTAADLEADVLLIVDGMNEVKPTIRGRVFALLTVIASKYSHVRVVAADRLNPRNIPSTFENITILPLSEDLVERHLSSYKMSLSDQFSVQQLFVTPYFLDMQLEVLAKRGSEGLLGRETLFHTYLTRVIGIEEESDLEQLAHAAFSAYSKYRMRIFEPSWWANNVPENVRLSLLEGGEVVNTEHEKGKEEMLSFRHQLLHDFLVGKHLATKTISRIDSEVLDQATFNANSLEPLFFTAELAGDDADEFIILVYNWSYKAAISCVSDLERTTVSSPVSKDLRVAIAALNAEKLFDPFESSVAGAIERTGDMLWAEAQRLHAASSVEELVTIAKELKPSTDRYKRWQVLFTRERGSRFRDEDIQSLVAEPMEGWTTANMLRRIDLDEVGQGQIRAIYHVFRQNDGIISWTNRWRVVHVLGAYPAEENLDLLFEWGLFDVSWVSYGSLRSIVEIASRSDAHKRDRIFARLMETMRARKADEAVSLRQLYRWSMLAGRQPLGWVEALEPVLRLARNFSEQDEEKAEWQSLFLRIEKLKVAD